MLSIVIGLHPVIPAKATYTEKQQNDMSIYQSEKTKEKRPRKNNFSKKNKALITEVENVSEVSGEETADILNEIEDNQELFEFTLKSILEKYYSVPEEYIEQIEELKEGVKSDLGEKIIEGYEAAQEERSLTDSLNYSTGQIIVVFEPEVEEIYIDGVAEEQFGEVNSSNILEQIEVTGMSEKKREQVEEVSELEEEVVAVVDISLGQTVEQAVEMYSEYDNVMFAEPDYLMEPAGLTEDTYSNDQWYLNHINIKAGWNALASGAISETYIAVIDTGIETTHPDLKNVYLKNQSVDVTISGYPKLSTLGSKSYSSGKKRGHGTRMSGVIAAEANNGRGIAGVATGADPSAFRIMAIKAVLNTMTSDKMHVSDMVKGIYYAVDHGADVINISFGLSENVNSSSLITAIRYAYDADVPIVNSAGNDGEKVSLAGIYAEKNLILVAATDKNNKRAVADSWNSAYGNAISIAAPGVAFRTTEIEGTYISKDGGTSGAAAIVTGIIANMKAITFGEITSDEVVSILTQSATSLGVTNLGAGEINGGLAIQMAKNLVLKSEKEILNSVSATTTSGTLKLRWDCCATCADGYLIYRSTSKDGAYSLVKTVSNYSANAFTDKSLTSGKTYYYKIRGYIVYGSGKKYSKYSAVKSGVAK